MLYKTDKDLPTIISMIKGVCIIFYKTHLETILGIKGEGNKVTVYSNKKNIDKCPDRSYAVISDCLRICSRPRDMRGILHGDSRTFTPSPSLFLWVCLSAEGDGHSELLIMDLYMLHKIQN